MTLMTATIKCNVCDKTISHNNSQGDSPIGWTTMKRFVKTLSGLKQKNLDFCSDVCLATWSVYNLPGITFSDGNEK